MYTLKTLNKIFKKHGNRLVALKINIEPAEQYINVRDIEDLVRIADEINKPIMYKYSSTPQEITRFYIIEENTLYLFDLKEYIDSLEKEKAMLIEKKKSIKQNRGKDKDITT